MCVCVYVSRSPWDDSPYRVVYIVRALFSVVHMLLLMPSSVHTHTPLSASIPVSRAIDHFSRFYAFDLFSVTIVDVRLLCCRVCVCVFISPPVHCNYYRVCVCKCVRRQETRTGCECETCKYRIYYVSEQNNAVMCNEPCLVLIVKKYTVRTNGVLYCRR